jgi:SpoVK/Ycf46/Vps4 family AAA+-type ATPase
LIIGATNLPKELDDAVRRRFVKRLYIPLPNLDGRYQLIKTLTNNNAFSLS